MRRRHFVALLGAAALPLPVRAQPEMVVAGFLSARSPHEAEAHTAAFLRALAEAGYVPGRNLKVEYRWAEGHYDRLPTLATDLAQKKVAFIAAVGGINRPSPRRRPPRPLQPFSLSVMTRCRLGLSRA